MLVLSLLLISIQSKPQSLDRIAVTSKQTSSKQARSTEDTGNVNICGTSSLYDGLVGMACENVWWEWPVRVSGGSGL